MNTREILIKCKKIFNSQKKILNKLSETKFGISVTEDIFDNWLYMVQNNVV